MPMNAQLQRKAKIVATLGPASDHEDVLAALIEAGLDVARLNFSHGTQAEHAARIEKIRRLARMQSRSVGILQDLQGPKIRVGDLTAPLTLQPGQTVCLYAEGTVRSDASPVAIPVDFPELFEAVQVGDRLLLDDGRLELRVTRTTADCLDAQVVVGGLLSAHKGINLPGVRLRIPAFTEKDEEDLAFGLQQGVDAVAVSFVRSVHDVILVRHAIKRLLRGTDQRPPLLIAKLERPEALNELDEILEVVDGVMVARGDLGVEMPPEQVPVQQKRIIRMANRKAKLVITATQMLESMIHNPLPTRAEASDVANAIFDGTDAVMLSAETAAGEYPVESVRMMGRIIREAEAHFFEWGENGQQIALGDSDPASMARAAHELARDRDVAAVAVFTMRGTTAWLMSKVRPRVPVLAFTPEESTFRQMAFLWGVRPQLVPFANTLEEMLGYVDTALVSEHLVSLGQQVVLVCGFPVGAMRPPNMALLHTVGQ